MSDRPPSTNIVLVGFMGSGKSSVGRLLATYLGFQFVDTDALIVQAAGMPISEIFAKQGEEAFRDLESQTVASLKGRRRLVIATGGGVVIREANRAILRELGFVVGLTADEETIFERVSRNNKRPLLQTPNPRQTISELLQAREPFYRDAAEFVVDTTHKTHHQVAEAIIAEARKRYP